MEKNSKEMVKVAYQALENKKGEDIRIIDIQDVSVIADYFTITSGSNVNQVQALVDHVEDEMEKAGYQTRAVEGYSSGNWILLDYNDIIIHVFNEEQRLFYDLERIWKDGKDIDYHNL